MIAFQTKQNKQSGITSSWLRMNPLTCTTKVIHSGKNTIQPVIYNGIRRAISPAVSEWQEVKHTGSFLSLVSDPLQRDTNQVHLPATQRLLAAHHASEQRGRSLQLPRYRHGLTNYHTHADAISLSACVSGEVWMRWRRDRSEKEIEWKYHMLHLRNFTSELPLNVNVTTFLYLYLWL